MASVSPSSSLRRKRYKRRDIVVDYAHPVLEITKTALGLAPVPGLLLIAELLSAIIERLKVMSC